MAPQQTRDVAPRARQTAPFGVVDCDIHERPLAVTDLVPYLEPRFRRYLMDTKYTPEYCLPFLPVTAGGGDRADARPADGGPAGADTEVLRTQLLDKCNEEVAILCGWLRLDASGTASTWIELKTALMSAYNDWIIDKWLSSDERFVASIHLNAHDPEGAVREIERLAPHPRMVQAILYIGRQGFGSPPYHPIYEAAQRHGLVVAIHHCQNAIPALGYGRYYIEWTTCLPQVMQSQLASMVYNGVFEKFPRLKVIMLEAGFTWVPSFLWRMDQRYRELRAEVPWLNRRPSQMVRDQVRFATQPVDDLSSKQLLQIFEQLESDEMVCFSTDYPHWDFDSPWESLPHDLPEVLKRKILRDNALHWYDKLGKYKSAAAAAA